MSQIDKKLAELGITLPTPAKPVANYVGWVRTGNLVYTAGQVTLKDGKIEYQGKGGKDFSVEDGAKLIMSAGLIQPGEQNGKPKLETKPPVSA